jgi:hypothetical protein
MVLLFIYMMHEKRTGAIKMPRGSGMGYFAGGFSSDSSSTLAANSTALRVPWGSHYIPPQTARSAKVMDGYYAQVRGFVVEIVRPCACGYAQRSIRLLVHLLEGICPLN